MNSVKIRFKAAAFPKMLADLGHSNQFLKIFSVGSLGVSIGLLILVFVSFARPPVVIAFTPKAIPMQKVELPSAEAEIREAVQVYVSHRYNWDKESVDSRLEAAKAFIAPHSMNLFIQGLLNVRKFSKEKSVSQRAYSSTINVDLKRGLVAVLGDRITEIQGIKAAGSLNIELAFQSGPRTTENPWGIYIAKEIEK